MESEILISVIVPMFNPNMKELEKCLDSIRLINQNIEVILVDDGSFLVNVRKYCSEYVVGDSRFKYYHQKNKGVSAARNFGLSLAKGRFVCFIDTDDRIDSSTVNNLDSYVFDQAGLILFDVLERLDSGVERKREVLDSETGFIDKKEVIKQFLLSQKLHECWGKLYRMDIIRDYDIAFPEGMMQGEGTVFNCIYLQYSTAVYYKKEVFYHYRYSFYKTDMMFIHHPLDCLKDIVMNYKFLTRLTEFAIDEAERDFYLWSLDSMYTDGFGSRILLLTKHHLFDRTIKNYIKKEVKPLILKDSGSSIRKKQQKGHMYYLLLKNNIWFAFRFLGRSKHSTILNRISEK